MSSFRSMKYQIVAAAACSSAAPISPQPKIWPTKPSGASPSPFPTFL